MIALSLITRTEKFYDTTFTFALHTAGSEYSQRSNHKSRIAARLKFIHATTNLIQNVKPNAYLNNE